MKTEYVILSVCLSFVALIATFATDFGPYTKIILMVIVILFGILLPCKELLQGPSGKQ